MYVNIKFTLDRAANKCLNTLQTYFYFLFYFVTKVGDT